VTDPNGLSNLVPGITYSNVAQCALVLEDNPVEGDSRLNFESFPEDGIEESYGVTGYREIASSRMPQPGHVAYRGGNWSAFSVNLKFRAGDQVGRQVSLTSLQPSDLESILLNMQRKVRWCQALAFPLERDATTFNQRVISRAISSGISGQALVGELQGLQLTRNDPPFVLVVFGSFLTLRCYLTGYSIKWTHPFHPVTAQPYGAEVNLQFMRLDLDYPTWHTIRNQSGKLPQSPLIPRIPGNVLVPPTVDRFAQSNRTASNAQAQSLARQGSEGFAASSFLSTSNNSTGGAFR